jgi:hypothetical protein
LIYQNDLKISKTYYFRVKKIQIFSEALLKITPKKQIKIILKYKKIILSKKIKI